MHAWLHPLSQILLSIGLLMWFWGTWPLLQQRSLLVKLHRLSVADTLGSALMLAGLWLRRADLWPLLLLALIGLMLWNTIFGYVLASSSQTPRSR
ncbi:monovalent cation/H(+) antiporter subunit G [Synechococcus sp. HK01-R]|uniref:monovalent cation/H(+) antiporter subunit G n=1 Tax=Synechococcus sp. HK01-R TaxID=2751171 RepID=UPI00162450FC|nr:monovalent cation/H(+) antiporter subunit G [Synechococcus sp. HK01-R]QNG26839.1 monovalent cation/H(+) antiporter subunit G [Synechococcus sp. HK01-R]